MGSSSGPHSGRLAATGVVVIAALGDLLLVVALLSDNELPDRQHYRAPPRPGGTERARYRWQSARRGGRRDRRSASDIRPESATCAGRTRKSATVCWRGATAGLPCRAS